MASNTRLTPSAMSLDLIHPLLSIPGLHLQRARCAPAGRGQLARPIERRSDWGGGAVLRRISANSPCLTPANSPCPTPPPAITDRVRGRLGQAARVCSPERGAHYAA